MKPIALLLALALASLATAAAANEYKLGTLEIQQPWTRTTPKGAKTAAGTRPSRTPEVPGVIWVGSYFQVGLEAIIPINRRAAAASAYSGSCTSISMTFSRTRSDSR
jgi:hypothetical protein